MFKLIINNTGKEDKYFMYVNSIPAFKGLITGKDNMHKFALNTDRIIQLRGGKRDASRLIRNSDGTIGTKEIFTPTTRVYFDNETDTTIFYHIDDVIAAYQKVVDDPTAVAEITKTK